MTVGILALQGAFREHEQMLQGMGVATRQIRLPRDLNGVERLIIPGGESTTIGKLMVMYDLLTPLRQRIQAGMPVWGPVQVQFCCRARLLMVVPISRACVSWISNRAEMRLGASSTALRQISR